MKKLLFVMSAVAVLSMAASCSCGNQSSEAAAEEAVVEEACEACCDSTKACCDSTVAEAVEAVETVAAE